MEESNIIFVFVRLALSRNTILNETTFSPDVEGLIGLMKACDDAHAKSTCREDDYASDEAKGIVGLALQALYSKSEEERIEIANIMRAELKGNVENSLRWLEGMHNSAQRIENEKVLLQIL